MEEVLVIKCKFALESIAELDSIALIQSEAYVLSGYGQKGPHLNTMHVRNGKTIEVRGITRGVGTRRMNINLIAHLQVLAQGDLI